MPDPNHQPPTPPDGSPPAMGIKVNTMRSPSGPTNVVHTS